MTESQTYYYYDTNSQTIRMRKGSQFSELDRNLTPDEIEIIKSKNKGLGAIDLISSEDLAKEVISKQERDKLEQEKKAKEQEDYKNRKEKEAQEKREKKEKEAQERRHKEATEEFTKDDPNAGGSCAVCKENKLNCICEVIFQVNKKPLQEYYWKSRKNGRKAIPKVITVIKDSKMDYTIVGKCKYENDTGKKHCTHLYYYKDLSDKKGSIINWETAKSGTISLPYDAILARERRHKITLDPNGNHSVEGNETTVANTEKNSTAIDNVKRFIDALSLFVSSNHNVGIPSTVYRIGVTECGQGKDVIDTSTIASMKGYAGERKTTVVVLPEYSVEGELSISIEFNLIKNSAKAAAITPTISVTFSETIEGNKEELSIDLGKDIPAIGFLGVLDAISDFLTKGHMSVLGSSAPFSVSAFSKIALSGVGASLDYRDDGVYVKRTGNLVLDPLLGMKIVIDLIDVVVAIVAPGYVVAKRIASTSLESASEIATRFSTGGETRNFGDILSDGASGTGSEIESVKSILEAAGEEYRKKDKGITIVADLEIQGGFNAKWGFFNNKLGEWPIEFNYASVSLGVILTLGIAAKMKAWIFDAEAKVFIRASFIAHIGFVKKENCSSLALWHEKLSVEWGLSAKASGGNYIGIKYEKTGVLVVLEETTAEKPSVIFKEWVTESY